ncbi:MAG: ATP-binding cassette domain-containing protein [Candidatus Zixiibacteriota bacterium]
MIHFDTVTFSFPHAPEPVLRDFSLTINDGEQVAVMGRNGCGKTTMGMLLAGILTPQSGQITVTANGEEDKKPVIGFLFQDPDNGLVATTVEREVAFALENQNIPSHQMRPIVDEMLESFDLSAMRSRLVWELSGGEKQRLSLAGLIAASPDVLFLDEPSSFLDYRGTQALNDMLRRIAMHIPHVIIIRITQFVSVAEDYPRLLLLGDGAILRDGKPETLFGDANLMREAQIKPPLKYRSDITGETNHQTPNSPRGEAVLTCENVSFSYEEGKTPLFNNLSLRLHANEVVALVGSSGAGKSTLAQLLCGIYDPITGNIQKNSPQIHATMCFQQPERQFYMETVYDEVAYGIINKSASTTSTYDLVRSSLSLAGLNPEKFLKRDPRSLSGGEARRLAFAVLLALDSDIIIFDEPTCGLDDVGIGGFLHTIELLRQKGKTLVIISHNSDVLFEAADRIAVIAQNHIAYDGQVAEFFTLDEFKGLLETPQVIRCQTGESGAIDISRLKSIRLWGEN